MFEGIGDAIEALFGFAVISFFVAWPLAIWKIIEIIIWLIRHFEITWVG